VFQVVATGILRAQFDAEQKIELFEFICNGHEEYISRRLVIEAAKPAHNWVKEWHKVNSQDSKQSPEMSKKGKAKPMKSPPTAPPDLDLPHSAVKQSVGITGAVNQFLEVRLLATTLASVVASVFFVPRWQLLTGLRAHRSSKSWGR